MSYMEKNILSGDSFCGQQTEAELKGRRIKAERLFKEFLETLGYNVSEDPNMYDTPKRVVKMYMKEICKGTYEAPPKVTVFPNQSNYDGIVFEGGIKIKSLCSHHLAFIKGKAYVAYIPGNKIIGLSKINRIVDWFARRPQLQERMTSQIHEYLDKLLEGNRGVAVLIEANHSCVSMRGIEDELAYTTTCKLSGAFLDNIDKSRDEFYKMVSKKGE